MPTSCVFREHLINALQAILEGKLDEAGLTPGSAS